MIQPPRVVDKFTVLGVPKTFALGAAELEQRYRDLSRKLHPDRFAKASPEERMRSLQAATTLNEAHRTLKRDVPRAEYLLSLLGRQIDDNERVDPAFLMEVMELREGLAEAKAEGDARRVDAMGAEMRERRILALTKIAELFATHERSGGESLLDQIKAELVSLRYFQRFLDELEAGQD